MRKQMINPDMVNEIIFLSMLVAMVFALLFTFVGALHW